MKPNTSNTRRAFWALVAGLVSLADMNLHAAPYATCLTNDGVGTVSFRLNMATATNDTVLVISGGGAVTNYLQQPSADLANFLARGLIVTNLGVAPGNIQVQINHIGSGQISTNGAPVTFNAPRGVDVNRNPSSPYFGWVYVGNSAAGAKGDGMFVFTADLADITGQGNTAKTGGYTGFGSSTTWSPYRVHVAPDDKVLVGDTTDATGALIAYDPLLTAFQHVLKPLTTNGNLTNITAAPPIGSNNVHGSVHGGIIVGTGANRVLYTIDEDWQQDPETRINSEWNSLWKYDIGNNPFPWSNAPVTKLMTPYIRTFAGQNMELAVGPNGYIYVAQRRSNAGQYGLYVVDPANPIDPTTYAGAQGGYIWNSQDESLLQGWSDDLLRELNGIAVSSDGKFLACMIYGDAPANNNAGLGISVTNRSNDIILIPLVNGIPNLAQRVVYRGLGLVAAGRGLAFDAADNLYVVSSGQAVLQMIDIGLSAVATTSSDGTFLFSTPSTEVNIQATVSQASEAGPVNGQFTLTRVTTDLATPLTVFYNLTGTASNGVDYTTIPTTATFGAGVDTITINVSVTDDNIPEPTESVRLALLGGGKYTVGTGNAAQVDIADNETPQLRVSSASTNFYEGNPFDFGAVTLLRYGDTNLPITLETTSFSFSGVAVSNVDFYLTNLPAVIDPGMSEYTLRFVYPIDDALIEGPEVLNFAVQPGAGYTVANNTGSITITDDDQPAETVLLSENFNVDTSSSNWLLKFASLNAVDDYTATFAYDYSTLGIPSAPNGNDTLGLLLRVNKDGTAAAAGINLYNAAGTFSGNYALRFDMFLIMGSGASTTEYAMMGLNHSGNAINWFRNSGNGFTNSSYDGIFTYIEADGASLGNNTTVLADYIMNTGPVGDRLGVWGPLPVASRLASDFYGIFKSPPWTPGANYGGVPSNLDGTGNPCWAEVELSQIGTVVTLRINNTQIMSFNNTNASTSGKIMLGYDDAYDSIGPSGAGVIYDNVRVVRLDTLNITSITIPGANAAINFTFPINEGPAAFRLQSATTVTGPYADDNTAVITQVGTGQYQATTARNGGVRFYRVRHL